MYNSNVLINDVQEIQQLTLSDYSPDNDAFVLSFDGVNTSNADKY